MKLSIWKIHPDVRLPKLQTAQSACFDIEYQGITKGQYTGYTKMNKPFTRQMSPNGIALSPGDRVLIPTGLVMDIPKGYSVRIHPRSGLALKQGLVLANAEGVIDSDYIEEVFVMLTNTTENTIQIKDGDRIAQGELVKVEEYTIEESVIRPSTKTARIGGFGSTGISSLGSMIKINVENTLPNLVKEPEIQPAKRGRGRPRKNATGTL